MTARSEAGPAPAPWSIKHDQVSGEYRIFDARGDEVGVIHKRTVAEHVARSRNTERRLGEAARDIVELTERLRVSLESETS